MFCPYAVDRKVVTQTIFEYDESGSQTMQQTIENNEASFTACKEKECGAWQAGRCQYRATE